MAVIKSRKASVALAATAVVFALLGTGCGSTAADNYTGEVTVESTSISKKKCYANVILENGQKDRVKIGKRVSCQFDKGSKIRLKDGDYVKP